MSQQRQIEESRQMTGTIKQRTCIKDGQKTDKTNVQRRLSQQVQRIKNSLGKGKYYEKDINRKNILKPDTKFQGVS